MKRIASPHDIATRVGTVHPQTHREILDRHVIVAYHVGPQDSEQPSLAAAGAR